MSDPLRPIRLAARSLRRTPAFTLLAVLTIALGVGATTAVFSMVNGLLLRRLPYGNDGRLVRLVQPSADQDDASFSVPEIEDYRARLRSVAALSEYHSMPFQIYGQGEPQRALTGVVNADFFSLLGVRPLHGRLFLPGEDAVGAPNVLVLSHRYWRERFGGDPSVVGKVFTMNDRTATVIGVLPPLPVYPDDNDIWMPAGACPFRSAPAMMAQRDGRMLSAYAVLRPGVTLEAGARELTQVAEAMHREHPQAYPAASKLSTRAESVREELVRPARRLVLTLLASAGFLLVVAAANFANLTLSRQLRRSRELALRTALGAGRGRLFGQLAAESLVVTLAGGALGVALAFAGLGLLRAFAARVSPRAAEIAIDPAVLGFALATSVLVGLAAAVAPLFRRAGTAGGGAIAEELRAAAAATTGGRHDGRARGVLVASQVAVAFVILVGAGLLVRSLLSLQRVNGGFDGRATVTARVDLDWTRYRARPAARQFAEELVTRLAASPGVAAVAVASDFPLNNAQPSTTPLAIRGRESTTAADRPRSAIAAVSESYFRTIGVPVLRGRAFTAADRDSAGAVALVSRRLAERYWPGADPIGAEISANGGRSWVTVVGVVGDVTQNGPAQGIRDQVYIPYAASPTRDFRVLVRTARSGGTAAAASAIRATVRAMDDKQPVVAVQTLDELRDARLAEPRVTALLVASFALVALVITAGGLAGVVAHAVSQRVAEIGIRVALGADAGGVLRLVLRGGLRLIAVGLAAGVVTALAVTPFVRGLLFGVPPADPLTFGAVGLALLGVGVVACWVPARAALAVDPVRALRGR